MLSESTIEEFCGQAIQDWQQAYAAKNYELAEKQITEALLSLKPIYRDKIFGETSDYYTYTYLCLIYFKGVEDLLQLVKLTSDIYWPEDHKKTEGIWYLLWDAIDRLEYFDTRYSDRSLCKTLLEQLRQLESNFYDLFGRGLYASPEIIIKKSNCTICGQNIKSCMHIPGNIYNGLPCKEKAEDISFRGCALVNSPHDMRCRIWPWNMKKDNTFEVRIMNLNAIDDFINE